MVKCKLIVLRWLAVCDFLAKILENAPYLYKLEDALEPYYILDYTVFAVHDTTLCLKKRDATSMQTFSPFVDSSVNNVLLQTNPDFNPLLLEFIHILERCLIDLRSL